MARRGYPPEFRRRVLDLVEEGRKVSEIAIDFEISDVEAARRGEPTLEVIRSALQPAGSTRSPADS